MPRRLVGHMSSRYIAGEHLDDALAVVRQLSAKGMVTTLDVLGESITHAHEAEATCDEYLEALDALAGLGDPALINVSVKLTALGLAIDEALCERLTRRIAERATSLGGYLRIDMEDAPWTDATLALAASLTAAGNRVGVVVQAYLHRSAGDIATLAAAGADVRIVKGIYLEPESIAWHDMSRINDSYEELCRTLLQAGCRVAFATHDDALVRACTALVRELGVDASRYEFQMLLGVREQLRDELVAAGHPMRVYVPFGARWYEYSIRRLRENPRVAGLVARDILRSVTPGGSRASS